MCSWNAYEKSRVEGLESRATEGSRARTARNGSGEKKRHRLLLIRRSENHGFLSALPESVIVLCSSPKTVLRLIDRYHQEDDSPYQNRRTDHGSNGDRLRLLGRHLDWP